MDTKKSLNRKSKLRKKPKNKNQT